MSQSIPTPTDQSSGGALSATLLPSVLRTVVPIIYALLIRWGVVSFLNLGDAFWNNVITTVVTGLFYVVLRFLERHQAQLGWLLGYAQQPVYVKGEVLNVTTEPTPAQPETTTTKVQTDATPPAPDVPEALDEDGNDVDQPTPDAPAQKTGDDEQQAADEAPTPTD